VILVAAVLVGYASAADAMDLVLSTRAMAPQASAQSSGLARFFLSDTARHFASGATASMVTDAFTFPLDTLKKNLQAGCCTALAILASRAIRRHALPGFALLVVLAILAIRLPYVCHTCTLIVRLPCLQAAPTANVKQVGNRAIAAQLLSAGGLLRFYHGYSARLAMIGLKGAMDNLMYVWCKRALEPYI
jgi:hypothetical protein